MASSKSVDFHMQLGVGDTIKKLSIAVSNYQQKIDIKTNIFGNYLAKKMAKFGQKWAFLVIVGYVLPKLSIEI